jgi:hypothetical protein
MKLRHLLIALPMLLGTATAVHAEISVSIGINMPAYPRLVMVPGYPVYYDPYVNANYFFYDGMYWVYQGDNWYASSWYNGPWQIVDPFYVPEFVLRVPVRYYRQPPRYFRGWRTDAPPHWGEHWGRDWQERRGGWDRWDRRTAPRAAPLPNYQRQYSGSNYPHAIEQQQAIRSDHYRYQPHEAVTRQHFEQRATRDDARIEQRERAPSMPPARIEQRSQQIEQRPQQMQAPQMERREHDRPESQDRGWENRREERGPDRR